MPTLDDLLQAKSAYASRLLRNALNDHVMSRSATMRVTAAVESAGKNVHAVGIGHKITNDTETSELAVRFYVVQKLARSLIPPRDLLPEAIDGVPTDVIESPPAFIQPRASARAGRARKAVTTAAATCTSQRKGRQRPVVAGISVAHRDVTAGTIGYFCRSTRHGDLAGTVHLLSNNHVLADVNRGSEGDDVYQPGPADGGTLADHCADLRRFVTIRLGGTDPNHVDCAIASLRASVEHRLEVCSIGRIAGTEAAAENLKVRKHGRTTGYTEGKVTDIHYDVLVGMDHNNPNVVALFQEQMRIEASAPFSAFGLGGDSGSLVVAGERLNAVGLYFAGPDVGTYGIANHIGRVLDELEVELLV